MINLQLYSEQVEPFLSRKQKEKEDSEKTHEGTTDTHNTEFTSAPTTQTTPNVSTAPPISISVEIEDNSSQDSIQREPDIEVF